MNCLCAHARPDDSCSCTLVDVGGGGGAQMSECIRPTKSHTCLCVFVRAHILFNYSRPRAYAANNAHPKHIFVRAHHHSARRTEAISPATRRTCRKNALSKFAHSHTPDQNRPDQRRRRRPQESDGKCKNHFTDRLANRRKSYAHRHHRTAECIITLCLAWHGWCVRVLARPFDGGGTRARGRASDARVQNKCT